MLNNKILVLDDERLVDSVFEDLKSLDVDIFSAKDSITALRLSRDHDFLCVISELKTPLIDNVAMEKIMKKNPTIIVTDNADPISFDKAKSLGAIDFLSRPYSGEDLLYIVENLIEEALEDAA